MTKDSELKICLKFSFLPPSPFFDLSCKGVGTKRCFGLLLEILKEKKVNYSGTHTMPIKSRKTEKRGFGSGLVKGSAS
jgi:hypothetical protein